MDREKIFGEVIRALSRAGFDDLALIVRTFPDGVFLKYVPVGDLVRIENENLKIRKPSGKNESVRLEDVVRVEIVKSLKETIKLGKGNG
jgi:hypothetical protein